MTSSLVGSEMCIRDRERGVHALKTRAHKLKTKGKKEHTKFKSLTVGVKPVSYTHLTLPTICSV
eukprot:6563043-Prorocentrum_lima.AAC.1